MHVCMYTMFEPGAYEDQKRASDPLRLELVMCHHAGAGS